MGKESTFSVGNKGNTSLIPGSGRSPGGGHGSPLQYPCLENPWTEEPSGLQSMGSQSRTRVKGVSTHACTASKLSNLEEESVLRA